MSVAITAISDLFNNAAKVANAFGQVAKAALTLDFDNIGAARDNFTGQIAGLQG